MNQILLVEDDAKLRSSLADYLGGEGFQISEAGSCREASRLMATPPSLVILDWKLPDGQGLSLLKEWRMARQETPVILLTARADIVDKVLGLEVGANDYVTKPFEPRELLARIHVQLRNRLPLTLALPINDTIRRAGISVSRSRREVHYLEQFVDFTKMEFELLRALMESPGQVFSRDELLNRVWGYDAYPTTRTVDTHILALRTKLSPDLFETVRGIGYRFTDKLPSSDKERNGLCENGL